MLQASTITADTVMHGITLAAALIIAIVGYKVQITQGEIKVAQGEMKAELVDAQSKMQRDMDAKHSDNRLAIQVHQAEDAQRFDAIGRTLNRIDGKLDRLNGVSH